MAGGATGAACTVHIEGGSSSRCRVHGSEAVRRADVAGLDQSGMSPANQGMAIELKWTATRSTSFLSGKFAARRRRSPMPSSAWPPLRLSWSGKNGRSSRCERFVDGNTGAQARRLRVATSEPLEPDADRDHRIASMPLRRMTLRRAKAARVGCLVPRSSCDTYPVSSMLLGWPQNEIHMCPKAILARRLDPMKYGSAGGIRHRAR